jgi:hypothetical protein
VIVRTACLWIACLACAASTPARPSVRDAAHAFDDAQLHQDLARIDHFLANDFVFVPGRGVVGDRQSFLDAYRDPETKLDPFQISHFFVKELGADAAIVGAEAIVTGTTKGEKFSSHFRYADVFLWRDGRRQVVYTQVTKLPDKE